MPALAAEQYGLIEFVIPIEKASPAIRCKRWFCGAWRADAASASVALLASDIKPDVTVLEDGIPRIGDLLHHGRAQPRLPPKGHRA